MIFYCHRCLSRIGLRLLHRSCSFPQPLTRAPPPASLVPRPPPTCSSLASALAKPFRPTGRPKRFRPTVAAASVSTAAAAAAAVAAQAPVPADPPQPVPLLDPPYTRCVLAPPAPHASPASFHFAPPPFGPHTSTIPQRLMPIIHCSLGYTTDPSSARVGQAAGWRCSILRRVLFPFPPFPFRF